MQLEKRKIGDSSLEIGVLGLGCAPLGGNFVDLDYAQGAGVISAAYESGLRFFDTAPWYGFGRSERIVGDLLRGKDCIISSKVGRILKVVMPRIIGVAQLPQQANALSKTRLLE